MTANNRTTRKEDLKTPKAYLAEIGRRGGKAGRGFMKARRPAVARRAARARWDKVKSAK